MDSFVGRLDPNTATKHPRLLGKATRRRRCDIRG